MLINTGVPYYPRENGTVVSTTQGIEGFSSLSTLSVSSYVVQSIVATGSSDVFTSTHPSSTMEVSSLTATSTKTIDSISLPSASHDVHPNNIVAFAAPDPVTTLKMITIPIPMITTAAPVIESGVHNYLSANSHSLKPEYKQTQSPLPTTISHPTSIPHPEDFHNATNFGHVSAICGQRCEVSSLAMLIILCFMVPALLFLIRYYIRHRNDLKHPFIVPYAPKVYTRRDRAAAVMNKRATLSERSSKFLSSYFSWVPGIDPVPKTRSRRSEIPEFEGVRMDDLLAQRYGVSDVPATSHPIIKPLPEHGQDLNMPTRMQFRPRSDSETTSEADIPKMRGALHRVSSRYPVFASREPVFAPRDQGLQRGMGMGSADDYCPRFPGKAGKLLG
ncbi:hypothetical protein K440DRAFT_643306 [Wilcoxina mikolae CBS 423.85]|nr:hypothetical protein K440DRAFT_643306 [Wilcoxina mikolae CBS 423.85]